MSFDQLSLFDDVSMVTPTSSTSNEETSLETDPISSRLLKSFGVASIPFINCDYDRVYPEIASIVPGEKVIFEKTELNTVIACETVCAAICHQMNWDFLRTAVWKKTQEQPQWISAEALINITSEEVRLMLKSYNKPDRIRANERATILREVGFLAQEHGGFYSIFFDSNNILLSESRILENMWECPAFSKDPEKKKFQLLLQKLSNYEPLKQLAHYCKPAIDYHLIRCFLRRGLIYWKNELGKQFFEDVQIQRKESTVGALRQKCSVVLYEICNYTDLSVNTVNQIEWNIGRSVCKEGHPDCLLEQPDSRWLRRKFKRCPFYMTCCAINFNSELLRLNEPTYIGSSY